MRTPYKQSGVGINVRDKRKTATMSFSLEPEILKAVKEHSANEGLPTSHYVNVLLRLHSRQDEQPVDEDPEAWRAYNELWANTVRAATGAQPASIQGESVSLYIKKKGLAVLATVNFLATHTVREVAGTHALLAPKARAVVCVQHAGCINKESRKQLEACGIPCLNLDELLAL